MDDDTRLDRLYDYTKFHIGIYLSAAGGLAALIALASDSTKLPYINRLIGTHWALVISFALMVFAGISGAIVATSTIESETYTKFIQTPQGAYGFNPFPGKTWVTLEHACFWLSLLFLGYGVFSATAVRTWVLS
ncbi:hypothetical protein [Paraburkholderia flagellata]|uniref:hypothetical protein n=1 Tax=Paraburkholderia flagellata TaxID=2883241 RepID=UPI001F163377|nr:hypothetical protein [Paraburkholderia flagellata]